MDLSDEALVLAYRRGDASGWETLVRRYQGLPTPFPGAPDSTRISRPMYARAPCLQKLRHILDTVGF
jgi:hypothetical protein